MKILITGGSGFIGTRLVSELLDSGYQVTIFDKKISSKYPEMTVLGDVRDTKTLMETAVEHDIIYHLAAEHTDNVWPESLYYDVNVGGTKNVVTAANNAGINKIIFTSSVAVYPLDAGEPDEDSLVEPFNEYGRSKYAAEQVLAKWVSEDDNRSLATVRPCVIFGEDNRGNVYNLLSQICKKRFIMVGSGKNKKSMGYVGNIVKFLSICMDFGPGLHLFNYADKPDLTTSEIVRIAKKTFGRNNKYGLRIPYNIALLGGYVLDFLGNVCGKTFSISSIRMKKFSANTTISTDRLLKIGFGPVYSIEQALEKTIKTEF